MNAPLLFNFADPLLLYMRGTDGHGDEHHLLLVRYVLAVFVDASRQQPSHCPMLSNYNDLFKDNNFSKGGAPALSKYESLLDSYP
jgi:hypothetical protein